MLWWLIGGLACGPDPADGGGASGAERPRLAVFPSVELVDASGHLDLTGAGLPQAEGGTPVPVERLAWRDGFSVVQTTVFDLGVGLDPTSLPGFADPSADGSVQIWDLDAGRPLLCFAEVDAWPDNPETPVLLVRPLEPMDPGHRVAVLVTDGVRAADGGAVQQPGWFADAVAGQEGPGLATGHYGPLLDAVAAAGGPAPASVVVATDFPVGDGTAPLRHLAQAVGVPGSWEIRDVDDVDEGASLPTGTWQRIEGTFQTDNWLVDDDAFALDLSTGLPDAQGSADAFLYIWIPESARGAEPGTVPVWLFGHGIFSKPDNYLGDAEDPSGVVDLASRAGAIVVATRWRGLTYTDLPVAVQVGNDFGRFPELSDKLAQGVANNIGLSRLVLEGGLLQDPVFMGLPDERQLMYYGISLGGIEGAVMLANQDRIEHGVLHVGGSAWSTMLERSSNWTDFETLMRSGVPSAKDRQVLYAASQLFWDPVDPAAYADELVGRSLLFQESIGDEQVPNMTTELLLRRIGAPLVEPAVTAPTGLVAQALPVSLPAVVQFDPQTALPPDENRPAPETGAHGGPRLWLGTKLQTMRFLDPTDPGVIEHFCGDAPCAADNQGQE